MADPDGLRASDDGVVLEVLVIPRASRNELGGWDGSGRLRVRLTAPPVEGREVAVVAGSGPVREAAVVAWP